MSETMTRKVLSVRAKALGDRQVETIASTATLDRENDRILPTAWRLDNYKRTGAPVLWGHDYHVPPVARSVEVRVVGNALRTVDEFPPPGIYPLADTVYDLVKAGFINSKSVGFKPLKWRGNDEGGRDYTEVELLENSYVSVAANPEALVVARSKGVRDQVALNRFLSRGALDDDLVLLIDEPDEILVDREEVRRLVRSFVATEVPRQVRRQLAAALGPEEAVLVIDDDAEPTIAFDPADLKAAFAEVVGASIKQAINAHRGRVD